MVFRPVSRPVPPAIAQAGSGSDRAAGWRWRLAASWPVSARLRPRRLPSRSRRSPSLPDLQRWLHSEQHLQCQVRRSKSRVLRKCRDDFNSARRSLHPARRRTMDAGCRHNPIFHEESSARAPPGCRGLAQANWIWTRTCPLVSQLGCAVSLTHQQVPLAGEGAGPAPDRRMVFSSSLSALAARIFSCDLCSPHGISPVRLQVSWLRRACLPVGHQPLGTRDWQVAPVDGRLTGQAQTLKQLVRVRVSIA